MLKSLLLCATVAALALPAGAMASTASVSGGQVVWQGTDQPEEIYVYAPYDDPAHVHITGTGVEPGAGCTLYEPGNGDRGAQCPNTATWKFLAAGGDDTVHALSNPRGTSTAGDVQIDLGAGDDTYDPSLAVATVHGGPGNDNLSSG